jgi:hypothetical protein
MPDTSSQKRRWQMNKDAYYFPHFSNARHDRKIKRLRKELGIEGYGIYFMILEVLRDQEDFSYPMSDIDLLADEFNTSEQKIEVVVTNYGLFKIDQDKFFYSIKLIEYLKPYLERSKRARDAALKRWHGNSHANADANALPEQSAGNASKVNESKREDSKDDVGKDFPDAVIRIANLLKDSICRWDPDHKYNINPPAMKRWYMDIEKAMRLDKRTEEQLEFMIRYIFEKNTRVAGMWQPNIQSGNKLRDKFDQVKGMIKNENKNQKTNGQVNVEKLNQQLEDWQRDQEI